MIEAIYPATSLQQGFIYHYLSQPEDDAYRVQQLVDYHQSLDVSAYQQAWKLASLRYPVLRTCFNWDNELMQIITSGASITEDNFTIKDISHLPVKGRDAAIIDIQQEERQQPFDLTKPGLIRLTIIKQDAQLYTVLKTEHHSIADGWSGPVLSQVIHQYYNELVAGNTPTIVAETAYLQAQDYYIAQRHVTEDYWLKAKEKFGAPNDINYLLSQSIDLNKAKQVDSPAAQQLIVQGSDYSKLKSMCSSQGVTLNVALQFAWHKLIQVYTQDEQTIVGTIVSGRDIPVDGIESSVGFYINTLPLTVDWSADATCGEMLQAIQQQVGDINSFSSMPLVKLQTKGERLFHSLFVFENYPVTELNGKGSGGLMMRARGYAHKTDYSLTVKGYEQNNSLVVNLEYNQDYLVQEKARVLLKYLQRILVQASLCPEQVAHKISLLDKQESQQLLYGWNQTDAPFPQDKTLQQLFEEQVARTPDNIALVFENKKLTYQELNSKANQLGRLIRKQYQEKHHAAIKPDTLIALYLDRSLEMVVSILAVLKAGGAYVPISPEYPAARTEYMLQDTQAPLLITQERYLNKLDSEVINQLDSPPLLIDAENIEAIRELATSNIELINTPTDLAYVIYTSGTTGKPKGVLHQHGAIVSGLLYASNEHNLSSNCVFGAHISYMFSPSVRELFLSLIVGGKTVVFPSRVLEFMRLCKEQSINVLIFAPSYISVLLSELKDADKSILPNLKLIYLYGESVNKSTTEDIFCFFPGVVIKNQYGPTETGQFIFEESIGDYKSNLQLIQFYRRVPHTKSYVLDKGLHPVPIGAVGELYCAGESLARSYLNQPELNKEKFIDNHFATKEDKYRGYTRLYKTGDLVCCLSNGGLQHIGRNDFQIKIRGFRIELGEIENALSEHDDIKQAVVIDREREGNKYLAAYIILEKNKAFDEEQVRQALSTKLPDYMTPTSFTLIDALPLTINGKLDRKALPELELQDQDAYVAPSNELEQTLCTIWQELLGLEQVGVRDDFFRLGGNSILSIRVAHRMSKALDVHVSVADIFEHKTIQQLARRVSTAEQLNIPVCNQAQVRLSFAQERLWFIEQYEQGTNAYHIPYTLELAEDINLAIMEKALATLVQRHAILRTVFKQDEAGQDYQLILNEPLAFGKHTFNEDKAFREQLTKDVNQVFNLRQDYPIRVVFYNVKEDSESKQYLLINIHHAAFDGWSSKILLSELHQTYEALLSGNTPSFAPMPIQYKDFAHWQRNYLQGEVLAKQVDYWKGKLAEVETINFPTDYPRPVQVDYRGAGVGFDLDENLSAELKESAKAQGCTLYTVLLSGFYILLHKYTGQESLIVGTPTASRHYQQLENLVGFFVNSLAIQQMLNTEQTSQELINQVHHGLIDAQRHQDLPFEKLVEELQVERDTSRHPLFQVLFAVQDFGMEAPSAYFKRAKGGDYNIAKFDLSLFLSVQGKQIQGWFNYKTSLFKQDTIERVISHYQIILQQLVAVDNKAIEDYQILSQAEYKKVVVDWNQTDAPFPQDKTLQQLFEEQVARTPDNFALVFENKKLTYQELNAKANQLARLIRKQYQEKHHAVIKPDTLIALYLDRSLEMVVSILAVLKAGGAYVPISPEYPAARTEYMLQDTKAPLLITQERYLNKLDSEAINQLDLPPLLIDAENTEATKELASSNLELINAPTDLAYVIYTSGTTGKPKGVEIGHASVSSLVYNDYMDVGSVDSFAFLSSPVFDAATFEIWTPLLHGRKLAVARDIKDLFADLSLLKQFVEDNGVTALWLTKSLFNSIYIEDDKFFSNISYLIVGGEELDAEVMNQLSTSPNRPLHILNGYGPTESTTFACVYLLDKESSGDSLPIGRLIKNRRGYVLDKNLNPVPIGIPGELYIGGAGLARGYLNQPELTKERFIDNPFATPEDKAKGYTRLYKTGDMVRWLPDGNLEYLGRNDFQIKIRGFRVELGEIESTLSEHDDIKQAVVIDREREENKYLAAYIILEKNKAFDEEQVRQVLSAKLPDYMMPTSFTLIDAVPLTINGKLDRKALPEPELQDQDAYVAPSNELEQRICAIWQELLGLEQVGIHDGFFNLGGNSLLTIKLHSKIKNIFDIDVNIVDAFQYPTVSTFAGFIRVKLCKDKSVKKIKIEEEVEIILD